MVFLIPVVLCYALLEFSVLQIPMSYTKINSQIAEHKEDVKVMILGSSQMQAAVNPEFLDKYAINFGSRSQHHKEDNFIMTQTMERFPKLETIVFELSFGHLEIPHNGNEFWKNNIYLKYYNVNAFERKTYFKDKLIFLSSPPIYSKVLVDNYIKNIEKPVYNKFGYNKSNFGGSFKTLKYDEDKIANKPILIRNEENPYVFSNNTAFFYVMIKEALSNNKKVVIANLPTYKTYLNKRNPNILKRRDSVLKDIKLKFPDVQILNAEADTFTFGVKDFRNENHLNAQGAEKFTKKLNKVLND